ncbi:MAG: DNA integrity scanning protein DisA nucleotide-binding domain protein [bacterium]|nr:DNA integrity scanning protein DisA nucleotide-binding domain protein [bacterium]
MIPNWFDYGSEVTTNFVTCGETTTYIKAYRPTPELESIRDFASAELKGLIETTSSFSNSTAKRIIQEAVAIQWLTNIEEKIDWKKLIEFNDEMHGRTYENDSIAINLLFNLEDGTPASFDVTDSSFHKLIDPLGKDQSVFFVVNGKVEFIGYEYVRVDDIGESYRYKFYPEFLHSYQQYKLTKDWHWSFHRTTRGDLIICDSSGLRASYRKGNWYLYDPSHLKNMLTGLLGSFSHKSYRIGCNLYEILFDLSYKRHGALLVFTNNASFTENVSNQESIIGSEHADEIRKGIGESFNDFRFDLENTQRIYKRKFLEMSSMDGAIIFGDNRVYGFGSMIRTADGLSAAGARTTAALSARRHDAFPVKVSSDGEITMFHPSTGKKIEFM